VVGSNPASVIKFLLLGVFHMKIGLKLTVIMIALGLVSSGVISIVLLVRAQTNITDLADKYLLSLGEKEANEITSYLEEYWHTVQSIGHTMEQYTYMVQGNRRNMFNVILEGQTRAHPEVIGMWCVWERDVLEGNDQAYIGTKGTNSRGYFTPYYYWEGGVVKLDAVEDFDVPGPGDCYLITKKNDATTILDPYVYDGQIMTTVATPIRNNGRQIGVVGIDIFLDELQRISQTSKPFPDSLSAVFSNDFTVAAHFATDAIGQNATQTEVPLLGPYMNDVKQAAKDGKFFKFTRYIDVLDNTLTCMFIPVRVKDSNTPWSVASGSMVGTVFAPLHDMQENSYCDYQHSGCVDSRGGGIPGPVDHQTHRQYSGRPSGDCRRRGRSDQTGKYPVKGRGRRPCQILQRYREKNQEPGGQY